MGLQDELSAELDLRQTTKEREGTAVPAKSAAQMKKIFALSKKPGSGITPERAKHWARETKKKVGSLKKLPKRVKKD